MKSWKKIFIGISIVLVSVLIVGSIISYYMLKKSLPNYNDELKVSFIKNKIEIYRDENAIPLIEAANDEDVAFAIGYLHAQERLFQMDIARRAGEGRLSEIFGSKLIPIDKMFRTMEIYKIAKASFLKLNPLSQKVLIAYSKGVNEFIKNSKGKYQVEFDILGYDPELWKPEHSLIIAKLMGWELNISWWTDIVFSQFVQKFGEEKAKELIPHFPENAPTITPQQLKQVSSISSELVDVDRQYRKFVGFVGTHIGSNNWVVNSQKSVSGKPIIANDPHLAFSQPGKWYFVMIRSNNWNAEGFSLPGLPSIVIGKNQNIAWAMTNVMADDADFYIEKLDSSKTKYFLDGNWKELKIYKDTIKVKDSSNVVFEIKKTHRGPIVTDIHPYQKLFPKSEVEFPTMSMRWTGFEFSDEVYSSILLNKAKNWNDFNEALKYFTIPGQNFVYADKQNNIGYICAVRLPIRKNNSPTLIYDGTTSNSDWIGFVPFEQLPKLFNPSQNFIASANNKTIKDYPIHISNLWEPSSRIDRITELLLSKQKHSVEDFMKYQMDFVSPYAKEITKHILTAFQDVKIKDKNLQTAIELLNNWNFELNEFSQTPAIYSFFLKNFIQNVWGDELSNHLLREYIFVANVPYRKIIEILNDDSSFFDNVKTQVVETQNDIIRKSMADALSELEKKYGSNVENWQWGKIHKVEFKHMFSGQSSIIDKLVNVGPYSIGGDGTTIFNTEYSFSDLFDKETETQDLTKRKKFENYLGPSMRYIFDFAQPDYLYFILPTGQAGHFLSNNYKDMTNKWLKGSYIKLKLNENEFIKSSEYKLTLIPN
ncbi:penicillin acylase family protein [Stygiobacter electus]|uniref:Penicillin acylase family protein n=1 Tax=Stygiobacter electus TaxID=3032292 RepID=A0AAE3P250_9BACT|nr:penicillin acylase family protein [Stygiobacter electus]MDF1612860.1 penicillin acylase family protein [Stygiobacter electus]